jgi:hypothetical protein
LPSPLAGLPQGQRFAPKSPEGLNPAPLHYPRGPVGAHGFGGEGLDPPH